MNLELVVRQGELPGHSFRIARGEEKTLGRAPECEIYLPDQGVSRRHCLLKNLGQKLQLVDLESANGSYINGKSVDKGVLRPGDQLTVGPAVLECRISAVASHAANHEPALAYSEEGSMTVLRKVVETQFPRLEVVAAAQPHEVQNLMRAQRNLATAYDVSKLLSSAHDLDGLFEGVIDSIFAAVSADRAALILRDGEGGDDLKVVSARARSYRHAREEINVSRTVVRDVLENGVSSLSRDAVSDERYREGDSIISQKIRSVLCAPVSTDESVLGVLYADSLSQKGAFSESDLDLLALIGNQAGVAIHRAQLIAQLERFFFETIRAIVATIDAKDGYTHRHSERVAAFAERIANELGVSEEGIEAVKLSALLHDVGKIGVPESILNKPGRLTEAEFEEMKKHPVHGYDILTHIKIPRFQAVLPGVRHHHERWDGTGYPDRLAGEQIPFLGRLLAVADVLDALNSKRSYREGFGFDKTVEYIKNSAGSHFDPEIAKAAVILHQRGKLEVPADWIEPESKLDPLATLEG